MQSLSISQWFIIAGNILITGTLIGILSYSCRYLDHRHRPHHNPGIFTVDCPGICLHKYNSPPGRTGPYNTGGIFIFCPEAEVLRLWICRHHPWSGRRHPDSFPEHLKTHLGDTRPFYMGPFWVYAEK
jgi:hypothetical protein